MIISEFIKSDQFLTLDPTNNIDQLILIALDGIFTYYQEEKYPKLKNLPYEELDRDEQNAPDPNIFLNELNESSQLMCADIINPLMGCIDGIQVSDKKIIQRQKGLHQYKNKHIYEVEPKFVITPSILVLKILIPLRFKQVEVSEVIILAGRLIQSIEQQTFMICVSQLWATEAVRNYDPVKVKERTNKFHSSGNTHIKKVLVMSAAIRKLCDNNDLTRKEIIKCIKGEVDDEILQDERIDPDEIFITPNHMNRWVKEAIELFEKSDD